MKIKHKDLKASLIRWTIDDFFGHFYNKTGYLYSEQFSLDGSDAKFYLQVHIGNHLNFFLRVADMGSNYSININLKFWLENDEGEKCAETPIKSEILMKRGYHYGFRKVLKRAELESTAVFFFNCPAVICCEMTYQAIIDRPEPAKVDKKLREGLWKSYQEGLSDSFIIEVEQKQFKVLKTILSANSPVFERMLSIPNCKETQTGIVKIKDTNTAAMEKLIEYMYRGEVANLEPVAIDLFKLSHKYDVKPLTVLCAKAIGKSISAENLFEIIVIAYEYSCEHLKKTVFGFLSANNQKRYFAELTMSKKWEEFALENEELANEIVSGIYSKMGIEF